MVREVIRLGGQRRRDRSILPSSPPPELSNKSHRAWKLAVKFSSVSGSVCIALFSPLLYCDAGILYSRCTTVTGVLVDRLALATQPSKQQFFGCHRLDSCWIKELKMSDVDLIKQRWFRWIGLCSRHRSANSNFLGVWLDSRWGRARRHPKELMLSGVESIIIIAVTSKYMC